MNKRVLMRGGAFVAATALLATSLCEGVMAASKVELAKNIDDFSFKTVAYKTEATTDGGYVVGGKTIVCVKSPIGTIDKVKLGDIDDFYTVVDLEKCAEQTLEPVEDQVITPPINRIEDEGANSEAADGEEGEEGNGEGQTNNEGSEETDATQVDMTVLFEELCGADDVALASFSSSKKEASDDDYNYSFQCVDYMAKYTSAGKSVWAKPIFDRQDIAAVGETNNDYRLITATGTVYTFNKSSGEYDNYYLDLDDYYLEDGEASLIINSNGSIIVATEEGLWLYNKTGDYVREFEAKDGWEYSIPSYYFYGGLSMSGGKALIWREKDDDSSPLGVKMEIVEISSDLQTAKKRLNAISFDEEKEIVTERIPVGGNKNGDMIVLNLTASANDEGETVFNFRYESYDKDNKLIGTLKVGNKLNKVFMNNYIAFNTTWDLFGGSGGDLEDVAGGISEMKASVKAIDEENDVNKFEFYSRTLEHIGDYKPANDEQIHDLTVINNGTLVAVGATQEENSPNGLRAHLAAAGSTNPANPNTVDNIQLVAILSGAAVLGAAVLTRKKLARR